MDQLPEIPVKLLDPMLTVSFTTEEPVINVNSSSAPKKPSYTPQFTSEGSAILKRLNGNSQPVDRQNTRDAVATNLKDTLSIPAPTERGQSITVDSLNAGVKRKRDESSITVDFTQNTIPFSWKGPSATRQIVPQSQPTVQEARCSKCDGAAHASPLLTCTHCLLHWHQKCHPHFTSNGSMTTANFICISCTAGQEQTVNLRGKVTQQRQQEIDRLRQRRLSSLPRGIFPAKPHLVGFGAGQAPHDSRAKYFETLSKMDMLNVLSFCDQMKPNLLLDILVSVSKRHPDLPIFDSPDWESQLLNGPRPTKTSKHDEKPRHGHVLTNKANKLKQKTTKKILKRTRVIEVMTSAPEEDNVNVLPATWAKAGEGMYSKLPLETEDRSLLKDENDEESFSHFFVDRAGRQIMDPVGA
ncbi:hypothetical protein NW768_003177 [Fusarium equiseti]|uniref:Zinc finger PHD-type domain-containing protein n=1 Tax=Fusarium equiseti TaxID=61235 RepID=A0ABQ8RLF9_FUSEQ|nr:hypothetical protein NW768_003177 [Fusarium equiseti]